MWPSKIPRGTRGIKPRHETAGPSKKRRPVSSAVACYPVRLWLDLLERADLVGIYRAWCRELRSRGIPYVLVESDDAGTYPIVEGESRLPAIVDDPGPDPDAGYTEERVRQLLRQRNFRYHRIDLPFGLHTKGADRSATRDLVLPESLAGKSVLDVGSALGYFCFEAESRGAERVVGVELAEDRFQDALLLKDIKGSRVEFLRRDIVLDPLDETFDFILFLNVIHHLPEPLRAIRQLASITNETLVIEFPTLADRKFRKTANIRAPFLFNRLPLIGVSSQPQAKQTFVFTPSAIKRILLDHERLFDEVEILRSPMLGRAIAVCRKKG